MARPTKWRKIENIPAIPFFIPSETDIDELPENILKIEELEAIRLKDLEGLEQEECAARMGVSRPTFFRIISSAREKVADSLINGKIIHIEGGNFTRNICPVKCMACGKEWTESFENMESIKKGEYTCPACGSERVICNQNCKEKFCHKCCWRYGKNFE
jgi:Predicted DNA-binding proteins